MWEHILYRMVAMMFGASLATAIVLFILAVFG